MRLFLLFLLLVVLLLDGMVKIFSFNCFNFTLAPFLACFFSQEITHQATILHTHLLVCKCMCFCFLIYVRLVFVVVAVVVSIICEEALQATRHQQVDCQVRQGDIRRPHGRHQQLVLYVCRCYCFCSCLDFSHLSVSSSREKIIYTLAYLVYVARCFF